jgi:hypothetical protein
MTAPETGPSLFAATNFRYNGSMPDVLTSLLTIQPIVRLASLLAFAMVLPWQTAAGLCLAAFVLSLLLTLRATESFVILRGIRRIRFLLLSLAILYFGFTPGEPLFAAMGGYSPSREGVLLFVERGSVLVLMLVAALLVLRRTPVAELVAAMQALLSPLTRAGLLPAQFPHRLALMFAEVDRVENDVRLARNSNAANQSGIAESAANLWLAIEERALSGDVGESSDSISVIQAGPVPAWQWLLPVLIGCLGIILIVNGGN